MPFGLQKFFMTFDASTTHVHASCSSAVPSWLMVLIEILHVDVYSLPQLIVRSQIGEDMLGSLIDEVPVIRSADVS